jgi:hypothetical protein
MAFLYKHASRAVADSTLSRNNTATLCPEPLPEAGGSSFSLKRRAVDREVFLAQQVMRTHLNKHFFQQPRKSRPIHSDSACQSA